MKVRQLKQLLLPAAPFHEVDCCCSCCRCGGQWPPWKEGGSIPCIPCGSSCHWPVLCALFPLLSHPSSSLAQHVVQQLGAALREEGSVLHSTVQQAYFLLLHLFFALDFMLNLGRYWNAICCGVLTNFHNQQMYFGFHSFSKAICTVWMCLWGGHLPTRL